MNEQYLVTAKELTRGSRAFRKKESRDAMYRVATFLIKHFWGKPSEMADALGVLLLTWNHAFYRYGGFDFSALEAILRKNLDALTKYRHRNILDFKTSDDQLILALFDDFLKALQISGGKSKGRRTPVGVAKALHLLAPSFFPLWDDKIAKAYKCRYSKNPSQQYLKFLFISKEQAESVKGGLETDDASLLKLIDEYNYAKYTKKWI